MLDRRDFVLALCATGALTACQSGPPKPSSVVLNFAGVKGMNPGPDGSDRPVTVMIYRLRSTGKFNSADYFALEGNAAGTLGADLVGQDQVAIAPGRTASKAITVEADAAAIGLVALLRQPNGRTWRVTRSVSPGSKITVNVKLGPGGISA
ncbi:MAG: type VI secretion system-associated lipoprotein [Rhizobiales bacterium 65-79]|jgi:type VI secretion system protein VasD|nr:type VI secretion system lipoprotein TssJ [Hyphomicrobiales bacterium]OJU02208.1 MAG: type VI secretion system-associated lipoprotein [Rhizobiales bacterium 65-79]